MLAGPAAAGPAGYTPPEACAPCHARQWQGYRETGMGRSFARVHSAAAVPPLERFQHARSDRAYSVVVRGGRPHLRREQRGYRGAAANVLEREIHYSIGSGNHARSFLHRRADGAFVELPLSRYAARGGFWGMSPGYDAPNHQDFRRRVSDSCLFCHNAYPAVAPGRVPEGIDCQRCHGPGAAHVAAASSGAGSAALRRAIVHPGRLEPARRLEVCLQCHLETTSRPLPNAIRRYDREPFSYVPGGPLGDYAVHFDHPAGGAHGDKLEINSAGYRFLRSRCFTESRGRMTCTTCHDPHSIPRGPAAEAHYDGVCQRCHAAALRAAADAGRHTASRRCTRCHMPRRRAEDAVEVVVTDHWIQRRKPDGDLEAPLDELGTARRAAYSGPVELYYPPNLAEPARALYRALAQIRDLSNLAGGIPMLERALASEPARQPEVHLDLGDAYRRAGRLQEAAGAYARAAALGARSARVSRSLGEALLRLGEVERAAATLEQAPDDPESLRTLGVAYGQLGRLEDSLRALRRATALDPDHPLGWLNLGVTLEQKLDSAAGEAAYREAIRMQPDYAPAHRHLAALLDARGDREQAEFHRAAAQRLERR